MKDPYKVLGVTRDATDEQIKDAYRALAKKYHPDAYANDPLKDLVEEKMKEINEAYDQIQKERKAQGSYSSQNGGGYSYSSSSSSFIHVRELINAGRINEAESILTSTNTSDQGAEWNFLMGCVKASRGWYFDAQNYFQRACVMDPQNMEYRRALNNVQSAARGFRTGGYNTSPQAPSTGCDICSALICADCCCDCMGGDLIACC